MNGKRQFLILPVLYLLVLSATEFQDFVVNPEWEDVLWFNIFKKENK